MGEEVTTIDGLLPEVLIQIFEKFEEDSDLESAQQVCRRWSELVDKHVGRKVCIRDGSRGNRNYGRVELGQLAMIGIQSCYVFREEDDIVAEMEDPNENEEEHEDENENEEHQIENENDQHPNEAEAQAEQEGDEWQHPLEGGLKYPHLLKDLHLQGSLPSAVFVKLVEHARNLSLVEITQFALSKLRNKDLQSLAFPPRLKELKIEMADEYYEEDLTDFRPNLRALLTRNRFLGLTSLSVDLDLASIMDISMPGQLIAFVQEHNALQKLCVNLDWTSDEMVDVGYNVIPEPEPPRNVEMRRTIIDGIRRHGECHLRELDISTTTYGPNPIHGFPFSPTIEIIKEFLLNVVSLQRLEMTLEPIPSSTLQAICTHNAATLRELIIWSDYSSVDCSVFTSLQVGQIISVHSPDHGAIGMRQLPPTVTRIRMRGPIEQAEAEHILFHLPNIQEIELRWICRRNSFKNGSCVNLDMFRRFNENRRVSRLRVSRDCLADLGTIPEEGILNDDPTNPEMLSIWFVEDYFQDLSWILNEAGFYTNDPSPQF